MNAIGDHQVAAGVAAACDYLAALGGGDGHGLLAQDVLPELRGRDGVFAVHAVGQADIDGVHVFVVADSIVGLVGVDGAFGDAVQRRVVLALGLGMDGDQGGDFGGLGLGAGAHEDVGDDAEADGGEADGLICAGRDLGERGHSGGGQREGGKTGEGATVHRRRRSHGQQRMPDAHAVSSRCLDGCAGSPRSARHGILESAAQLRKSCKGLSAMLPGARRYKYLDALTTIFVAILLVSNLVAQKICMIGPFAVSGAVLLFPITYIFGDVFTEVYGFSASRRAIWLGTFGTALLYLMGEIVIALPGAPGWNNQQAFKVVFGFLPRIQTASLIAFWAGDFANSYTLARMKLWTNGKWLWTRTVGSTVVGQGVDTTLVITLTFAGKYPALTLVNMMLTGYLLKVAYEVLATPLTYLVVGWLKASEHADAFDRNENFNPFHLSQREAENA